MTCDRALGNIETAIRSGGDSYNFNGYCGVIELAVIPCSNDDVRMKRQDFLYFQGVA